MTPEEISVWEPFLSRIPLFSGLPPEDISRLAVRLQALSLPKGSTLFHPGDLPDAFYIITSGQVRVMQSLGSQERTLAVLGRGEMVGEGGILTGEPRSTTVRLLSTCEFLKLARKDFEAMLAERPALLLHVSRALARRLVPSGGPEKRGEEGTAHLISISSALGQDDRLLFALHLGLEFLEQTRRRVLLVDMSPDVGALAKALGLSPVLVTEAVLREANFRDPGLIRVMAQHHASGLGVLSLPAAAFSGRLFDGIYLFLNILREANDYVLVHLGSGAGAVAQAISSEADAALLVGTSSMKPQYRQLEAELLSSIDPKKVSRVQLGEPEPDEFEPQPLRRTQSVPWTAAMVEAFRRTASPYEALDASPKSRAAIDRLVRRLAGLRVGLALGTGAALGLAHIGILKVFAAEGIPIDVIAGTSMGALLAGFYALNLEPEEIEDVALGIDKGWVYENLLWDLAVPRSGFFAGDTLLRFLRSYFGSKEFTDLEIPYACVATDIENGEEIVLREGRVAEAIRASCGIPLMFSPFRLSGRYLVDGGLVNPVPVSALASLGADILIAVDVATSRAHELNGRPPCEEKSALSAAVAGAVSGLGNIPLPEVLKAPSLFKVFSQMLYTMESGIAQSRVSLADVVLRPDLGGYSWTHMHRAKDLIEMGMRSAEQYVTQIKSLLPFFADSCRVPLRLSSPWKQ